MYTSLFYIIYNKLLLLYTHRKIFNKCTIIILTFLKFYYFYNINIFIIFILKKKFLILKLKNITFIIKNIIFIIINIIYYFNDKIILKLYKKLTMKIQYI